MKNSDKQDRKLLIRALAAAICDIPAQKAILLIAKKN